MQDVKTSKADIVDKLLGRFLKDSADILAKPVSKCFQNYETKAYIQKRNENWSIKLQIDFLTPSNF